MKQLLSLFLLLAPAMASAEGKLNFVEQKADFSLFQATKVNETEFSYIYLPYNEWKVTSSGKDFPMEIAPVLRGMVDGGVNIPAPKALDASKYEAQAAEFAEVVNSRNEGGRAVIEDLTKDAATLLTETEGSTHVVEVRLSAVIDKEFSTIDLSPENVASMAENIDLDHYHFQIPGSFVEEALEQNHVAYKNLDMNRNYLLSVFDLRDYGCAVMKDGIRDYYSRNPAKERLSNESIYVISRVDLNADEAMKSAEAYFGKRPAAVITQDAMYADHLIRGAKTIFAFYPEGNKTRIVLLSNIAMGSKFFTGVQGALIRQYLLNGIGGGATGTVLAAKDKLSSLISGATADVSQKNSCDRGLALGLIKYSQGLFQEFVNFAEQAE